MLVFNNRRRRRAPIYVYTKPPEGVLVVHASTMKRVKNIQSPLPTSLLSDCSTVLNISDYQYIYVNVCVGVRIIVMVRETGESIKCLIYFTRKSH